MESALGKPISKSIEPQYFHSVVDILSDVNGQPEHLRRMQLIYHNRYGLTATVEKWAAATASLNSYSYLKRARIIPDISQGAYNAVSHFWFCPYYIRVKMACGKNVIAHTSLLPRQWNRVRQLASTYHFHKSNVIYLITHGNSRIELLASLIEQRELWRPGKTLKPLPIDIPYRLRGEVLEVDSLP